MLSFWARVCLWLPFLSTAARCARAAEQGVLQLSSAADFDELVVHSPEPAFVIFHSSAQGQLLDQGLAELSQLANKYAGITKVATVDCQGSLHEELCVKSESVPQLPHMRIYEARKKLSPYTNVWYKDHQVYTDVPTVQKVGKAIVSQLIADNIVNIPDMTAWQAWVPSKKLAQVLVFSQKQEPSVLLRSMALRFDGRLTFALVAADAGDLLRQHGLESAPAVVVRKPSGGDEVFTGNLNAVQLATFLENFAAETSDERAPRGEASGSAALGADTEYQMVTLDALEATLEEQEDVWLLAFVAPRLLSDSGTSACTARQQVLKTLVAEVGLMLRVGVVSVTPEEAAAFDDSSLDLSPLQSDECGYMLRLKAFGDDKDTDDLVPIDITLPPKQVLQSVYEGLPDFAAHVTAANLQMFLGGQQPGSMQSHKPKIVLATEKTQAPPLFRLLAANMRQRPVTFGWYSRDLDADVAAQLPTEKYPRLLAVYVAPDAQVDPKAGGLPMSLHALDLPLKYVTMAAFVEAIAKKFGPSDAQVDSSSTSRRVQEAAAGMAAQAEAQYGARSQTRTGAGGRRDEL